MIKDLTYIPKYVREREREHLFVSSKGGGSDLIIALPQMRGGRFI